MDTQSSDLPRYAAIDWRLVAWVWATAPIGKLSHRKADSPRNVVLGKNIVKQQRPSCTNAVWTESALLYHVIGGAIGMPWQRFS